MYVQEIHIKSFRHLKDVHLGPFVLPPNGSDLVVLAGPNGGGKSSILELLGYALSSSWSLGWQLHRSFPENAFEVALAVTPQERLLIKDYIALHEYTPSTEALTYFDNNAIYFRAYNYSEGKYQAKAPLYNEIHNLVSNALRNKYSRPLGFFLRSDRYYPSQAFDRRRLFDYAQMTQREHIWSMAFNTSDIQYKDMFEFLVQQRYHYYRQLGAYYHKRDVAKLSVSDPPSDPLHPYDQLLRKLFPEYRFADANEDIPSNLFIQIPSGQIIPFQDLSSGEKEVFFILSFFLRHDVSNAVIVIDEPELHLHPELARLLVRTMQSIKLGNQVWLATHNPEIIDEAGRDRVIYVSRNPETFNSTVIKGTDEIQGIRIMRDMFGFSGYIGIAKRMVFLEGENSSADRKVFSNVFPTYGSNLKFIPANSSENQSRINAAIMSILEMDLGWAQFYLLRDRDYLTQDFVNKYNEHASGRVYVLKRHEIENYLLDDALIAKVQTEIFNRPTTADEVKSRLKSAAYRIAGEVLRDMTAFRLNVMYRPEDFSMGKLFQREPIIDSSGSFDAEKVKTLETRVLARASDLNSGLAALTSATAVAKLICNHQHEIRTALTGDDDNWRILFPGKRLMEEYTKTEGLGDPLILQNSLIKEMATSMDLVPEELRIVIRRISNGEPLSTT